MRYETMENIRAGDILASPIIQNNKILLQQNVLLTDYHIKKLKEIGYTGVYIFDKLSEGIMINNNIPLDLKLDAAKASANIDIGKCMALSKNIIDCLYYENLKIKTSMDLIGNYDEMTFLHSVNVAIYSGMLGIILDFSQEELRNLTLAALLHDIGKTQIDINILNKKGELTKKERQLVEKHPKLGYDLLKNNPDIASTVRVAVLQHHENYDGTGYPTGISKNDIHKFAQIIHICDVYDAMISKRPYKKEIFSLEALEYIMGQSSLMFHPHYTNVFCNHLVLFPEGVKVLLSNGDEAFVKANNEGYPTRPIVIDINSKKEIDLLSKYNITIIKMLI